MTSRRTVASGVSTLLFGAGSSDSIPLPRIVTGETQLRSLSDFAAREFSQRGTHGPTKIGS